MNIWQKAFSTAIVLLWVQIWAGPVAAKEVVPSVSASSVTYFRFYEVLDPGSPGHVLFQAPFLEYLSVGARDLGVPGLSADVKGFGAVFFSDPAYGSRFDGDLLIGNVAYRSPKGRFFVRAGRQYVFDRATGPLLMDGAYVRSMPGLDLQISAYGGLVSSPSFDMDPGRYAFGGRLAYDVWDIGHLGTFVTAERGEGTFARLDIGADYAFRYVKWLSFSGCTTFDAALGELRFQETRNVVSFLPEDWLRVSLDYAFVDPVARLPKTSIFSIFTNWRYHAMGGEVNVVTAGMLRVRARARYFRYAGAHNGYQVSLRPALSSQGAIRWLAGIEGRRVVGYENGYTSGRLFGRIYPFRGFDVSLDYGAYLYDSQVNGWDKSHVVTLTAGYEVFRGARIQVDCNAAVTPDFKQNWMGMLRFTYDFQAGKGG